MQSKKINSLQGLRCFAALIVCAMHIVAFKPGSDHWIRIAQYAFNSIGKFGVDLFFTISGFIVTWIVMKETTLPSFKSAIAFLIKRFFRVYPLYWVTLGFMIVVSIIMNGGLITQDVKHALQWPILALLSFTIPLQLPAWTLAFELYFYSVVFIFMCALPKKYFLAFFTLWALAHFLTIQAITHGMLFHYCFLLMHNRILEFFFGLLVGYLLHFLGQRYCWDKYLSIVLGAILLSIGIWTSYTRIPNVDLLRWEVIYYYAFPSACFVYGLVGLELQGKLSTPIIFKKLGDVSYSIYLWHFPIIQVTGYVSMYWLFYQHLHPLIQSLLEISLVILISFASYRWVERPCIYFSHYITSKIRE